MCRLTFEHEVNPVKAGHHGSAAYSYLAGGNVIPSASSMQRNYRIHPGILEDAVIDHRLGTPGSFLAGLKHKFHRAAQSISMP
jgi:hypothetical protein